MNEKQSKLSPACYVFIIVTVISFLMAGIVLNIEKREQNMAANYALTSGMTGLTYTKENGIYLIDTYFSADEMKKVFSDDCTKEDVTAAGNYLDQIVRDDDDVEGIFCFYGNNTGFIGSGIYLNDDFCNEIFNNDLRNLLAHDKYRQSDINICTSPVTGEQILTVITTTDQISKQGGCAGIALNKRFFKDRPGNIYDEPYSFKVFDANENKCIFNKDPITVNSGNGKDAEVPDKIRKLSTVCRKEGVQKSGVFSYHEKGDGYTAEYVYLPDEERFYLGAVSKSSEALTAYKSTVFFIFTFLGLLGVIATAKQNKTRIQSGNIPG